MFGFQVSGYQMVIVCIQIFLLTKIDNFSAENIGLLLSHGADLVVTNGSGRKPIHVANDEESLRLLLEHGANANAVDQVFSIHNCNQCSQLHACAEQKQHMQTNPTETYAI